MSVSFIVSKEEVRVIEDEPRITYVPLWPEGFDRTPVVDPEYPEYGAIGPENPWDVNVGEANAVELLKAIGIYNEPFDWYGLITDLDDLIARCDSVLGVISSVPEFDAGKDGYVQEGDGHATLINCGRRDGYFNDRISRIRALAVIAKEREAVISYA